MAEVKVVINDCKAGKSYQKVLDNSMFLGKKITDNVSGDALGLNGYELQITGGSDSSGFPMRIDVDTAEKKSILIVKGTGLRKITKGKRQRKTVRGNTISGTISQINLKVTKYGQKLVPELLGIQKAEDDSVKESVQKAA